MGWLVQAEAPPGALLRKLWFAVTQGQSTSEDLAFYFVHWFTDLAGAEPFPLEGCEKFVLKFPQAVLNQFLGSFSIIVNLSVTRKEAQVLEDYLVWRWTNHVPDLGPVPAGPGSIAKMRLILMAQGDSQAILDAFANLPEEDQEVLGAEMALTGCKGQAYMRDPQPEHGPAFLMYYGPALMQNAGKTDPRRALLLLAQIYRETRLLWPLTVEAANDSVTVRIDSLKEQTTIVQPAAGTFWAIKRLNDRESAVQAVNIKSVNDMNWNLHRMLSIPE